MLRNIKVGLNKFKTWSDNDLLTKPKPVYMIIVGGFGTMYFNQSSLEKFGKK